MFDLGGDDVALVGLGDDGAMDGRVVAFGAAACENDFTWIGVDKFGELEAGFIQMARNAVAKAVSAGRIPPLLPQKRQHRLDHLRRNPGRSVVIQIINFAIHSGPYCGL